MPSSSVPRTIVVATDFSENAAVATAWAAAIARQHGARLVLSHAVKTAPPPAPEFVPIPAQYYEELRERAQERLASEAERLAQQGLAVEWELGFEPADVAVAEAAAKHEADLVVAGTRGLTGWKRALLGSTAARLVRTPACPVLTVHPTDAGAPRPVETVLVPTDFSEDAAMAAEAALKFLGTSGSAGGRIVLVHAYRVPIEFGYLPARVLVEAIEERHRAAQEEIEALGARLRRPGFAVEARAIEGYPPQVILEQARAAHADLIAMGTHGRSGLRRLFLGSTAERVLPSAPCPVLTVHRGPDA